jgi:protein disulfide isomerase
MKLLQFTLVVQSAAFFEALVESFVGGGDSDGDQECTAGSSTELTGGKSVEKFIKTNPNVAIMFYAPWCYFCQRAIPEWKRAVTVMKGNDPKVCFAQANAMKLEEEYHSKFEIDGFPHFIQVVDGTLHGFHKRVAPTSQVLQQWIGSMYNQDHVIADQDALEVFSHDFLESSTRVVLGIYEKGTPERDTYVKLTRHFEDTLFAEVDSTERAESFVKAWIETKHESDVAKTPKKEDLKVPGVLVLTKHSGYEVYTGDLQDLNALNLFIDLYSHPLVQNVDQFDFDTSTQSTDIRTHADGTVSKTPALLVLFHSASGDREKVPWFTEAATLCRQKLLSVHAVTNTVAPNPARGSRSGMLATKHGVRHDQVLPVVRIAEVTPTGVTKYRPEEEVQNAAQVVSFVEAWSNKEVKPYYKSLPAPDPLPKGRLYEVVADSWHDLMKEDKDIFVNCFAPWCGHCQHLKPSWQELQKTTKYVETLRVVFFDATQNDLPDGIHVQGYPTILFFPAPKDGSPRPSSKAYRGGSRTVPDFLKFMHSHATYPFDENNRPTVEEDDEEDGILGELGKDL